MLVPSSVQTFGFEVQITNTLTLGKMVLVFESLILPESVIRKNWEECFANDFQNNFLKNCEAGTTGFSSKFCILILLFPFICVLSLPISVLLHLPFHAPLPLYSLPQMPTFPLFHVLFLPPLTECKQKLESPGESLCSSVFFLFLRSCQI